MAAKNPAAPFPGPARVREAVEAIYARRRAAHDDDLHLWSDHPAEVIGYVCRNRRVPERILVADARDALVLIRAERARLDQLELEALDICRAREQTRVDWKDLAEDVGSTTAQAAYQRRKRLRAARTRALAHPDQPRAPQDRARAWTLENGLRVRQAATALMRARADIEARAGDEDGWLDDIDMMLDDYQGSHADHTGLLTYFSLISRGMGEAAGRIAAIRTVIELDAEYTAATS